MKTIIIALAGLATSSAALADQDTNHLMIIGFGHFDARPGEVILTNQTAPASSGSEDLTTLDKFVVTGSLLGQLPKVGEAAAKVAAKAANPSVALPPLSAKDAKPAPTGGTPAPHS